MRKFGFIAHPIDVKSFYGFWGPFAKLIPPHMIKKISEKLPPYRLCSLKNIRSLTGETISGEIVLVPLLPLQIASMPEEQVLNIIEKAIDICVQHGAEIVGLGGFTSVVGNEGAVLSKRVKVPLTSGNTLTASLALDGIYKASNLMELNLDTATAAIIGATGDIGSICTRMLAHKVKKINIAARNENKLDVFAKELSKTSNAVIEVCKYTRDAIKNADIIMSATSSITTLIEPQTLKPGSIVCDVALPVNIAREVVQTRDDIMVFEGGLARIAYIQDVRNNKLAYILPTKGVYGCASETMALTFENRFENYSIGRGNIRENKIYEIKRIAEKHGIVLSDFFCGYRFFNNQDISCIKQRAAMKRENIHAS